MGTDHDSATGADLRIGPTTLGMVRISVEPDGGRPIELDFDPDEAEAIAEELRAAAAAARAAAEAAAGRAGVRPRRR